MNDRVRFRCPHCGNSTTVETKARERPLGETFDAGTDHLPLEIAVELRWMGLECDTPHCRGMAEVDLVGVPEMVGVRLRSVPMAENPSVIAVSMDAGALGGRPHSGPRVGPEASHQLGTVFPPVAASDLAANIVPDLVRVPQCIRGADGLVREYAPVPTVIVRANRDGVTYTWSGVSRDDALALFTPRAHPTVAEIIRALGPCTADLTERSTVGGVG